MILNIEGGRRSGKSTTAAKFFAQLMIAETAEARFAVVADPELLPAARELIESFLGKQLERTGFVDRVSFVPEARAASMLFGPRYAGVWIDEPDGYEDINAIWGAARTACRVNRGITVVSSTPEPDGFVASVVRPHASSITVSTARFTRREAEVLIRRDWEERQPEDVSLHTLIRRDLPKIVEALGLIVLDDSGLIKDRLRAADALVRLMEARPR